jgi:surface antigen
MINNAMHNLMKNSLLALALASAATIPAYAVNMSVFKDAPITRLTGEELKAFRAVVMKTLDETPDGVTVEWKAPKTRFASKLTPQRSFTDGKLKCRDATVESDAHDRFQRGLYTFCRTAKGDWQFRIPTGAAKTKKP